ncbi:MAG: NAD(P)-dependent oxidoreductase [Chloroflexota bacterium]|nr:NAD(P)-dependent oxidoreductase [Chloroflexota bacterium]
MRVLVTGGSGRLGQFVIRDLVDHGHEVVNADRRPPAPGGPAGAPPVRFVETDLGDVGQVAGVLAGRDAVVHLGAIPNPYGHADEVVFVNNTRATFAALQAASLLGVRKAAIASSVSAYGTAWAPRPFPPNYAPVDEEHPLLNHDAYGLSKEVDERTAQMFHRRDGMQVVALRFHWVALPAEAAARAADLAADPRHDDWWRLLWGYVDARDAATACRLAVEAEGLGFDAFNVTAADTLSETPTEELIRRHAPTVELRQPIPGTTSDFSLDEARRLLGYEPAHGWREGRGS